MPRPPYSVTGVTVLGHYRLRLLFEDGTVGDVDLSHLAQRSGVYEPLKDPDYFRRVHVDPEGGTVVWPNGVDLAPETLHEAARRDMTRTVLHNRSLIVESGIPAANMAVGSAGTLQLRDMTGLEQGDLGGVALRLRQLTEAVVEQRSSITRYVQVSEAISDLAAELQQRQPRRTAFSSCWR